MNRVRDDNELKINRGDSDLTNGEIKTLAAFVINNERINTNARYLEIGVFGGGTTKYLIDHTSTTQFTGIDLFEDFITSKDNTHTSGTYKHIDVQNYVGNRAKLIKGNSTDMLQELIKNNEKFDCIFIDGNHSYLATNKDFELSQQLLSTNGQVAFHNCSTYAEPDCNYIIDDGGPWRTTIDIINSDQWRLIADIDRLRVFSKKSKH